MRRAIFRSTVTVGLLAGVVGCGSHLTAGGTGVTTSVRPAVVTTTRSPGALTLTGCPPIPANAPSATAEYVDFIEAHNTQYLAPLGEPLIVPSIALGAEELRIRCSFSALNAATRRETPKPENGDAGFLAPGTRVYAITGWSALCRLAAQHGDDRRWYVYLAQENGAQTATPKPCALNH